MKTKPTCLLIDDDSDDQDIFVTAAAEVNSATTCRVISDAGEALQLLRRMPDLPDVIFLDINMPKMDGFEFLVELKRTKDCSIFRSSFTQQPGTKVRSQKQRGSALPVSSPRPIITIRCAKFFDNSSAMMVRLANIRMIDR